jgi:hypothetical protein
VGSTETKALIMGLLVMKLQEYRLTSGRIDSDLQHITILEEAHNLLKRTSSEQSSESSNLLGKSVEMLGNAIAEMRTYGEGFIIADQSPGLLDMSVIRNTNTKIILRLPDESDRTLVGKSAGLNDDQIIEIAKLPCGVAAVYQNEWIQPVLCKIHYDDNKIKKGIGYKPSADKLTSIDKADSSADELKKQIVCYLLSNAVKEAKEDFEYDVATLREAIYHSNLRAGLKSALLAFIANNKPPERIDTVYKLISEMYICHGSAIGNILLGADINSEWAKQFRDEIVPVINDYAWELQKHILQCIAVKVSQENARLKDLPNKLRTVI